MMGLHYYYDIWNDPKKLCPVVLSLLGCDISTPEGLNSSREKNLFTTICPKYVRDAAGIVEDILG